MGTRADFYVGRGAKAEWIGSVAYDGHPGSTGVDDAGTEAAFRESVADRLKEDDGTTPDMGWPWPWNNSHTTDYAYAFDGGKVWCSGFGRPWWDMSGAEPDDADSPKTADVPDMKDRRNTATPGTKRSGLMVFSARR